MTNAPVASKALARVLSAVPHGECKENSFSSSPDFSEPEKGADKDSCSTQPNTLASGTATGKIQYCQIFLFSKCKTDFCVCLVYILV